MNIICRVLDKDTGAAEAAFLLTISPKRIILQVQGPSLAPRSFSSPPD